MWPYILVMDTMLIMDCIFTKIIVKTMVCVQSAIANMYSQLSDINTISEMLKDH